MGIQWGYSQDVFKQSFDYGTRYKWKRTELSLCPTTMTPPVQPSRTKAEKAKLKNICPRHKRRVTQHLRQSSGEEPTADIKPEPLLCQKDIGRRSYPLRGAQQMSKDTLVLWTVSV